MADFSINIPTSLRDITLDTWLKWDKILQKNKGQEDSEFVKQKMLNIFCDISMDNIRLLEFSIVDDVVTHIYTLLSEQPELVQQFTLRGVDNVDVTFGLIPNLDKMSYGEFIDLNKYLFDEDNLHRAMAVLYRPLMTGKDKDRYLIHPYKGTDEMAEVMRYTPMDAFISSRLFFYRLAKKLPLYTMDYTLQQLQEKRENHSEEHLEKNGENISQSIHSHREMLRGLMKLQESEFTKL